MTPREAAITAASEMHAHEHNAARLAYVDASRAVDAAFRASLDEINREFPAGPLNSTTTKETL